MHWGEGNTQMHHKILQTLANSLQVYLFNITSEWIIALFTKICSNTKDILSQLTPTRTGVSFKKCIKEKIIPKCTIKSYKLTHIYNISIFSTTTKNIYSFSLKEILLGSPLLFSFDWLSPALPTLCLMIMMAYRLSFSECAILFRHEE